VPELPEVERAARTLTRAALGKTIAAIRAIHPSLRKKFTPAHSRRARGKRITTIDRKGKHQVLGLDNGDTLIVHFRMNGDWEIGTTGDELDRFARAVIELEDVFDHVRLDALSPRLDATGTLRDAKARFERDWISAVLVKHHGRVGEAARALGIQRTNLYRKVRQLNVARTLLSPRRSWQ